MFYPLLHVPESDRQVALAVVALLDRSFEFADSERRPAGLRNTERQSAPSLAKSWINRIVLSSSQSPWGRKIRIFDRGVATPLPTEGASLKLLIWCSLQVD